MLETLCRSARETIVDVLFDQLDESIVAEVDIYWSQVGGFDPAELVAELGTRVTRVHVKDGPAEKYGQPMTAVGSGTLDIPGVLSAAPNAKWHIVELDDCATDMFEAVEASYDFLVGNGISRGQR